MKLSGQYPISFVPRLEVYSIGGNWESAGVGENDLARATSRVGQVFCP
ncbi:MAG: hypothetical protein H6561_11790 [Lewinellaceae bacterium]|nr:hypothetical protein [Lewinellaceae bacterium]